MRKFVFFNTKGGTGKTTICYNYGWYLATKRNKKDNNLDSLIIDYINEKDISFQDYVIKINDNIDLLPSSNNISLLEEYLADYLIDKTFTERKIHKAIYRNEIIKNIFEEKIDHSDYDYVVIDSQPNFSLLSTTSLIYARHVFVVIKPEIFSFLDIDYLMKILKNMEKKFYFKVKIAGIIINAYEKRKKMSKYIVEKFYEQYGNQLKIFDQKIRYLSQYQKSIALFRKPIFEKFPGSNATKDIINLFYQIDKVVDTFIY